jgi:hypothetical protein
MPLHLQPQTKALACSTSPLDKRFGKEELWEDYEIAIGPKDEDRFDAVAQGDVADSEALCTVTIFDPSGKSVYSESRQNVALDDATGLDLDGAPDVILHHDNGGAHGAGNVEAISLKPEPHVLVDLYEESWGLKKFKRDSNGKVILSSAELDDELANDYGWPMARRPVATTVYRFVGGKLEDVTPEYCSEIRSNPPSMKMQQLFAQQALQDFKKAASPHDDADVGSQVLSLILQSVFVTSSKTRMTRSTRCGQNVTV